VGGWEIINGRGEEKQGFILSDINYSTLYIVTLSSLSPSHPSKKEGDIFFA
jgi:hypothetical protein